MVAGFGSEWVAGFKLECMAGFVGIRRFTTYSQKWGEEASFMLMRSLAALMNEAVQEYGGTTQGFTGDSVMAVFGAPVAFEDSPVRACRAALAILRNLDRAR